MAPRKQKLASTNRRTHTQSKLTKEVHVKTARHAPLLPFFLSLYLTSHVVDPQVSHPWIHLKRNPSWISHLNTTCSPVSETPHLLYLSPSVFPTLFYTPTGPLPYRR